MLAWGTVARAFHAWHMISEYGMYDRAKSLEFVALFLATAAAMLTGSLHAICKQQTKLVGLQVGEPLRLQHTQPHERVSLHAPVQLMSVRTLRLIQDRMAMLPVWCQARLMFILLLLLVFVCTSSPSFLDPATHSRLKFMALSLRQCHLDRAAGSNVSRL